MTKRHKDLNRLAGRVNASLPVSKHLIVHEGSGKRKKYTVKTPKNKTIVEGFDYRDTDLILRGMLELANLTKKKK